MRHLETDYNDMDERDRVPISRYGDPALLATLESGERAMAHDRTSLAVEVTLERDPDGTWWGRPDWATRLDIPYPFEFAVALDPLTAPARLELGTAPEPLTANAADDRPLAPLLLDEVRAILVDGGRDVEARAWRDPATDVWWAAPDWRTLGPRPCPHRIEIDPAIQYEPIAVMALDADRLARLGDALRDGLRVEVLTPFRGGEFAAPGAVEFDPDTRRWQVRFSRGPGIRRRYWP